MGHAGNWNRNERKLALERSRDAARGPEADGWTQVVDRWIPINTLAGAHLRRAVINGECRTAECSRRVKLDVAAWVKTGFGLVPLAEVHRLLQCGKVGCRFAFNSEVYPYGIPFFYESGPGVRLEIVCSACDASTIMSFEAFHAKIAPAGGSANTPMRDLAGLIRRRCPRCDASAWRVARHPPRKPPDVPTS